MKWGIRRTPEQLGHRVIKAGTTFYRQSNTPNETHTGNKYVSYADPDRDFYKGEARSYISNGDVYETKYTAAVDIIAPAYSTTKAAIRNVVTNNSKVAEKAMSDAYTHLNKELVAENIYYDKMREREKQGMSDSDQWKKACDEASAIARKEFTSKYKNGEIRDSDLLMLQAGAISMNKDFKNLVADELSKQGYNAVTDLIGQGFSTREGYDPLIVLNVENTLYKVSTHKVTDAESAAASKAYNDWAKRNKVSQKGIYRLGYN